MRDGHKWAVAEALDDIYPLVGTRAREQMREIEDHKPGSGHRFSYESPVSP